MRNLRLKKSRVVRLAAAAVAMAAAVAGATGIVAGQGNAAPAIKADKVSQSSKKSGFKRPKLKHGLLRVKGTEASDKIALRLQAGNPAILQVDVGDDSSADFSFERKSIVKIAVDARPGDDFVRIDDSNGLFTNSIPTTLTAAPETTRSLAAPEPKACSAATATTRSTATATQTRR
jgi:hypothetical protein